MWLIFGTWTSDGGLSRVSLHRPTPRPLRDHAVLVELLCIWSEAVCRVVVVRFSRYRKHYYSERRKSRGPQTLAVACLSVHAGRRG